MAHVYILKSINYSKTYVGSTVELNNRLKQHNNGKSKFTSRYKPWKLIFQEEYKNLSEARAREKYLKSAAGRRFIKKIVFENNPR